MSNPKLGQLLLSLLQQHVKDGCSTVEGGLDGWMDGVKNKALYGSDGANKAKAVTSKPNSKVTSLTDQSL